ncbi:MAG: hypothetical protein SGJ13_12580 [Actinomycetota bacterium]|nr:hypothetical protein [Actinomycetota bacterium]
MTRSRTRVLHVLVALTAAASLPAGCGGDDDDDSDAADTPPATEAESEGDDEGETVVVSAIDYGYEDLPDSVAACSTLTLHNTSDAELHERVAFRLADDETRSLKELLALPEAELEGGPPHFTLGMVSEFTIE